MSLDTDTTGKSRKPVRDPVKDEVRPPARRLDDGTLVVLKRDGTEFIRKQRSNDPWAIPPGVCPDGWTWEWKTETVINQEFSEHQNTMLNAGWEPVQAEACPGTFMPVGAKGAIRRDGMLLMERRKELTDAYNAEVRAKTRSLTQTQKHNFGMTPSRESQMMGGSDPNAPHSIRPMINRVRTARMPIETE